MPRQPRRGISFSEMLAHADAVHDDVQLYAGNQTAGGHTPVIGSIQSALTAVLQPVPWIGLLVGGGKPRRS